jgi:hypothetical protein
MVLWKLLTVRCCPPVAEKRTFMYTVPRKFHLLLEKFLQIHRKLLIIPLRALLLLWYVCTIICKAHLQEPRNTLLFPGRPNFCYKMSLYFLEMTVSVGVKSSYKFHWLWPLAVKNPFNSQKKKCYVSVIIKVPQKPYLYFVLGFLQLPERSACGVWKKNPQGPGKPSPVAVTRRP